MTDKELLEKAAMAAGIELVWGGLENDEARRTDSWVLWNPLADDGDALRLAVNLEIHIQNCGQHCWASTLCVTVTEPEGDDKCAATRLAITRTAAEMEQAK
jgi:hypothetical protein